MKKIKTVQWLVIFSSLLLLITCASGKIKPIKGFSYIPSNVGFGYKSTKVPSADFRKWAKENQAKLNENISELDDKFDFVVIGHTDNCGPEEAQGNKKGNTYYAQQRAKNVRAGLIRLGYSAERIKTASHASKDSKQESNCEPYNRDRYITFGIIKKPKEK